MHPDAHLHMYVPNTHQQAHTQEMYMGKWKDARVCTSKHTYVYTGAVCAYSLVGAYCATQQIAWAS